jgi:hypothetical protein
MALWTVDLWTVLCHGMACASGCNKSTAKEGKKIYTKFIKFDTKFIKLESFLIKIEF